MRLKEVVVARTDKRLLQLLAWLAYLAMACMAPAFKIFIEILDQDATFAPRERRFVVRVSAHMHRRSHWARRWWSGDILEFFFLSLSLSLFLESFRL